MGVLRLLGPDQSTLLFDFTAPTGTGNPNTLITELSAGVDFGTVAPALAVSMMEAGAALEGMALPPVEVTLGFSASAATDDDLWAGVGQLARYLLQAGTEHPAYLEWTELGTTYHYDVIGALELPQLFRGQATGAVISGRRSSMGPIPLRVLRQPWRRGASVTTSAEVVEDDPATGTPDQSRLASFTVTGDLPTPCKVRAEMDTGSHVVRVLMGHRWRGSRGATYLTDYRDETAWFQCEASGRGWTVTLGDDTSATTDGALASPGSGNAVAQVNGAGGTAATMARRMRAVRTTLLDSLRGSWRPYLRLRTTGAARWETQLRWGPSTADPVAFAEPAVIHDTSLLGTPPAFGYVELPMGRLDVPQVVALGGLSVEVWARRISGAGNLNMDVVWLPPAELSAIVVPAGSGATETAGADLTSPVANPAGGTAGTDTVQGWVFLSDTTDNAGLGPNAGTVYATGRWRARWRMHNDNFSSMTARLVIRNITGSSDTYSQTVTLPGNSVSEWVAEFDANGTSAYQVQVDDPSGASEISCMAISVEFIPAILSGESVRTDPGPRRYAVDRLDSSGNLTGYLELEGAMPLIGRPGDNQLIIAAHELPLAGYSELENLLTRDITVTVTFDPRYAL